MVTGFLVGLSAITLTFGPSALADPSDQDGFNLVTRPTLTLMAVSATGFLVRPMTPLVVGRGTPELVTRPTTPRGLELVARRPVTAGACTRAARHSRVSSQGQAAAAASGGLGRLRALPCARSSVVPAAAPLTCCSQGFHQQLTLLPSRPSRAQLEESLRRPSSSWCPKMS